MALQVVCDVGQNNFLTVLAIRDRRAMGLHDVPFCWFLLSLGFILQNFQIWGTLFSLRLMLYMCVSHVIAFWPKCFMCLMWISSDLVALF